MRCVSSVVIAFAGLCLFVTGCQKHVDVVAPPVNPPPVVVVPPVLIDHVVPVTITGRVIDPSGTPVAQATIVSGGITVYTGINGTFSFPNVSVSKYFGTVTVQKAGYFPITRTFVSNEIGNNFVSIELLPRIIKANFPASDGASIFISSGNITFPPNAIASASGAAFTADVNVLNTWLMPGDQDLANRSPGDGRAVDSSGKAVILQSFGIAAFDIESDAGEKLKLASGSVASISIPIPADLLGNAPASIPLWYFNDSTGRWIEQGTALRQDNNYVGNISHVAFWNCALPSPSVYVHGTVRDLLNNPVAYGRIELTDKTSGAIYETYSGSDGAMMAAIAAGHSYTLTVLSDCGNLVLSRDLSPASTDAELGNLAVSISTTASISISGTAIDCEGQPIQDGIAFLTLNGLKYAASVTNGNYSITIERCNTAADTVSLFVGDYATQVQSDEQDFVVTAGSFDAGQTVVCGIENAQYVVFVIKSRSYKIAVPTDSVSSYAQGIYAYSDNGVRSFNMNFPFTGIGTFAIKSLYLTASGNNYTDKPEDPIQLKITQYGALGQPINGSFSGNVYSDTDSSTAQPVSGYFKVLRNF